MKRLSIIPIVISALLACEKPVTDVEIPKAEKKVSVFCIISPDDSMITAQLSYSAPIFTQSLGPELITDADVELSGNNQTVKLLYNNFLQAYIADTLTFKIKRGTLYRISVKTKAGETVTANCIVPSSYVPLLSALPLRRKEDLDRYTYRILATWIDEPLIKNYYRLYTEEKIDVMGGAPFYNDLGSTMYEDKDKDGKRLEVSNYLNYITEGIVNNFDVYLLNTDVHYYKYHLSRLNDKGNDPFSEPNIVYSNIEGGLGCFGAYSKTHVSVLGPW
jgi:hypothetical protein